MTDLNTSNIVATISDVIVATPQGPVNLGTTEPKNPAVKAKLSKAERDAEAADKKAATLGDIMQRVGDELGAYTVEHDLLQIDVRTSIEEHLRTAMKMGLEVAMLKAPTKAEPRECYTCLVDALNAQRRGAGLKLLSDATRDNYMTRIRAFVRDRGANPLDLFGNLAVKAKKEAAKQAAQPAPAASSEAETDDAVEEVASKPAVSHASAEKLFGATPLAQFLTAWVAENQTNVAAGKFVAMATDMLNALSAAGIKA